MAAFSRRATFAPDEVYTHFDHGWRYVTVHPFADDHALLARIRLPPGKCTSVDAYWEYDGDVYLVQAYSEEVGSREQGMYYRWDGGDGYAANLVANLGGGPIIRAAFELVLAHLSTRVTALGRSPTLTLITE
jgi:hypothetical protein